MDRVRYLRLLDGRSGERLQRNPGVHLQEDRRKGCQVPQGSVGVPVIGCVRRHGAAHLHREAQEGLGGTGGREQEPHGFLQETDRHGTGERRPKDRPQMGRGTEEGHRECKCAHEVRTDKQTPGQPGDLGQRIRLCGVFEDRTHTVRIRDPGADQSGDLRAAARQISRTQSGNRRA